MAAPLYLAAVVVAMSRDPCATALRAAAAHGTPYAHRDGPLVVLVVDGTHDRETDELRGRAHTWMCSSSALARAVAARAVADLAMFPRHANPLAVSALYAEAAHRFALLRARRLS